MSKGDIHTRYDRQRERWINETEGGTRPFGGGDRKEDVQAEGRDAAIRRGVEHFIHKKERNEIAERNTYPRSRDPRRSKG